MAGNWNGTQYLGDATNEAVNGTAANESIFGNQGDDQLFGGDGNDYIDGGTGHDLVDGGNGDDVLTDVGSIPFGFSGLIGHDTLRGGAGNDELRIYSPDTGDQALGGAGSDLLRLWISYGGSSGLPFGTPITLTLGPNGATSQLQINGINALVVGGIETLYYFGGDTLDFITGAAGHDYLFGGIGDDHLFGGDGNDTIDGGSGVQDLDGGNGTDYLSFDVSGATTVMRIFDPATVNLGAFGSARNFEFFDNVMLGSGNDIVDITQSRSVTLATGGGNDRITIGDFGSNINAGLGDDIINCGNGYDEVDGGDGNNQARLGGGDDEYAHEFTRLYLGSETVWGELGNDGIYTAAGTDTAYGGDGNDTIYVGRNNDQAYGGLGNDNIRGEDGTDSLYGGGGNDTLNGDVDALSGNALIEADFLDGGLGDDSLIGGYGADTLIGGTGNDVLSIGPNTSNTTTDLNVDQIFGGAGIDKLAVYGPNYYMTQVVTVILGATTLVQFDGVTVATATGMEALDISAYGGGNHHIEGGGQADLVRSGHGNDLIVGFGGNDTLESSFGADTIYAGSGDDVIRNVEVGGADILDAGAGNDTVILALPYLSQSMDAGVSQIDGGAGFDTLVINSTDRNITFTGAALFEGAIKIADITGFEAITYYGTATGTTMTGTNNNDTLLGFGGNDTLVGLNGNDWLDGGANDDLVQGGGGNDTLTAGGGTDTLLGGGGDDLITLVTDGLVDSLDGGAGLDQLRINFGAASPIVMTGSAGGGGTISAGGVLQANIAGFEVVVAVGTGVGNDVMIGGSGNDTLTLYGGGDSANTGNGDDTVQLYIDGFADQINLGGGIDRITGVQITAGDVYFSLGGTTTVTLGGVLVSTWKGVESFDFSLGSGDDTVQGGALDDRILMGNGANAAQMRGGNDAVSLNLDALADTVDGGAGADRLTIYGGATAISVDVSVPGVVTVDEGGLLRITATSFEAFDIYGGYGAGAGDILAGLGGDDLLFGNAGADTISGGGGNDSISGGADADVLTGGAGADSFTFNSALDAAIGAVLDRITDFQQGSDLVSLSQMDANLLNGTFSNEAFSFIGALAFGGVAGELRFVQDVPNNQTLIEGDQNGDGTADFRMALTGLYTMTAVDFGL